MLAIAFTRQVGDLLGCALGFCLAGFVLEPDDRVRVAYVDIVAPKSHSERLHKTRCKDELLIRAAVPVCISQYRYSAGLGLGYENIAVWSKRHPARPVQLFRREFTDAEAGRQIQRCAVRPRHYLREIHRTF